MDPTFVFQNAMQKIDVIQFRLELVLQNHFVKKKSFQISCSQNLKQIPLAYKM